MSEPPAASQFTRVKDCDLCKALKLTPWFWYVSPKRQAPERIT